MPARAPTPCRTHGCPRLCRDGSGRCEQHQQDRSGWRQYHQQRGGSREARGYGVVWQRLRKTVIERDKGLCQQCQRDGRLTGGTDCDHIIPKARGGTDDLDNLELLCKTCHTRKSAREAGR